MLEGYIASRFANKYFEDSIFRIVKKHAIVVAILSLIPDLGIVYILGLWHMYVKIANKCDISFKDNFKSLIGTGMVVNVIIYIISDTLLTFFPFANPIIAYFLFYLSGKMYVESVKLLPLPKDEKLHLKNLSEKAKLEQGQKSENESYLYNEPSKLYCSSCGREIEYGSMFCPFCGAKIESEQTDIKKIETLSDKQTDKYKEISTNESTTCSTSKNNETEKSLIIVAVVVLTIVGGIISFRAIQTYRNKKMIEAELETTAANDVVEETCEDGTVSLERVIELFESIPDHEQVSSSSRSAMTADLYNTLLIAWNVPDNAKYISMIGDNDFLYYFVNGQDSSPIKFDETTIINSHYKGETQCTIEIGFSYTKYEEKRKMLLYLVKEQGRWMIDDFSCIYIDKEQHDYFVESQKEKCLKYINTSIKDWINGIPQNQILRYADSDYDKVKKFNSEFDAFFKTYPSMKEFADNIKKCSKADWNTTEYGFKVPNNMVSSDYIWVDDALSFYISWTNDSVQLLLWPDLPSWSVDDFPSIDNYITSTISIKSITYSNSTNVIFSGYASDGRIWYLKKIIPKGDVTLHSDCLILLYPKSEQNNVSELIEEVKNWDGR